MNVSWKVLLLLTLLCGCQNKCSSSHSKMGPEEVVEAYLNIALNMNHVSQKYELMEYTTSNLKAALAGATDETIMEAYIDRQYKFERFSLVGREDITPRETQISFQLAYSELPHDHEKKPDGSEAEDTAITTENTVSLTRENGMWFISDVVGNKTAFDFPISELSRITPSSH
ncbi:MAG: hypothetical protein KA436_07730 [Oligoflexales bacterium]|nr:hypothetical protein [Oligoflexales bacterium]